MKIKLAGLLTISLALVGCGGGSENLQPQISTLSALGTTGAITRTIDPLANTIEFTAFTSSDTSLAEAQARIQNALSGTETENPIDSGSPAFGVVTIKSYQSTDSNDFAGVITLLNGSASMSGWRNIPDFELLTITGQPLTQRPSGSANFVGFSGTFAVGQSDSRLDELTIVANFDSNKLDFELTDDGDTFITASSVAISPDGTFSTPNAVRASNSALYTVHGAFYGTGAIGVGGMYHGNTGAERNNYGYFLGQKQ